MGSDALGDFRLAASLRGDYDRQLSAAQQLLLQIEHRAPPAAEAEAVLAELSRELHRFITNISCRIGQRSPALRPVRAELVKLNRRIREHARSRGVELKQVGLTAHSRRVVGPCGQESTGLRHLCEHGCYYREFEPARKLHALHLAHLASGGDSVPAFGHAYARRALHALRGWSARMPASPSPAIPSVEEVEEDGPGGGLAVAGRAAKRTSAANRSPRAFASAVLVSPSGTVHSSIGSALHAICGGSAVAVATTTCAPTEPQTVAAPQPLLHASPRTSRFFPVATGERPQPAEPGSAGSGIGASGGSESCAGSPPGAAAGVDPAGADSAGVDSRVGGRGRATTLPAGMVLPLGQAIQEAAMEVPCGAVGKRMLTAEAPGPEAPGPDAPGPDAPGAGAIWRPPRSPFGLLEELLWDRPWALLLSCILLNQTSRPQVTLAQRRFPSYPILSHPFPSYPILSHPFPSYAIPPLPIPRFLSFPTPPSFPIPPFLSFSIPRHLILPHPTPSSSPSHAISFFPVPRHLLLFPPTPSHSCPSHPIPTLAAPIRFPSDSYAVPSASG